MGGWRGELLLWGCSQTINADVCLLSTQNTLRFSVLYTYMLSCWQTVLPKQIPADLKGFWPIMPLCWCRWPILYTDSLQNFSERENLLVNTTLWKKTLQMCPTLGMCIVIYVSENINLRIKHADKTCLAQGQETSILCLMEKFTLVFQAQSSH